MRILVDLDGVCADFVKGWVDVVNARKLSVNPTPLEVESVKDWHLHIGTGVSQEDAMAIFQEKGFFQNLKVIDGSREVLKHLHDKGHEIFFVTHCKPSCPEGFREKLEWVDEHFKFIGADRVVFTGDKHLVCGDVLIDDRTDNLEKWEKEWRGIGRGLCFDTPYNQDFKGDRAKNWLDVLELIAKQED